MFVFKCLDVIFPMQGRQHDLPEEDVSSNKLVNHFAVGWQALENDVLAVSKLDHNINHGHKLYFPVLFLHGKKYWFACEANQFNFICEGIFSFVPSDNFLVKVSTVWWRFFWEPYTPYIVLRFWNLKEKKGASRCGFPWFLLWIGEQRKVRFVTTPESSCAWFPSWCSMPWWCWTSRSWCGRRCGGTSSWYG